MTTAIACLVALVSTTAFVSLWFWVVRRELYVKQKAVEAARCQLTASHQRYMRVRDGPHEESAQEVLKRSQSVYGQAVVLYNEALHKPWNAVPAFFLGFRQNGQISRTEKNEIEQDDQIT